MFVAVLVSKIVDVTNASTVVAIVVVVATTQLFGKHSAKQNQQKLQQ